MGYVIGCRCIGVAPVGWLTVGQTKTDGIAVGTRLVVFDDPADGSQDFFHRRFALRAGLSHEYAPLLSSPGSCRPANHPTSLRH
jgi:hypothetical protein